MSCRYLFYSLKILHIHIRLYLIPVNPVPPALIPDTTFVSGIGAKGVMNLFLRVVTRLEIKVVTNLFLRVGIRVVSRVWAKIVTKVGAKAVVE